MKVQGTGKTKTMGADFFDELPDEVAEGLIAKGYVVEVGAIPEKVEQERPPAKTMTKENSIKSEKTVKAKN